MTGVVRVRQHTRSSSSVASWDLSLELVATKAGRREPRNQFQANQGVEVKIIHKISLLSKLSPNNGAFDKR